MQPKSIMIKYIMTIHFTCTLLSNDLAYLVLDHEPDLVDQGAGGLEELLHLQGIRFDDALWQLRDVDFFQHL